MSLKLGVIDEVAVMERLLDEGKSESVELLQKGKVPGQFEGSVAVDADRNVREFLAELLEAEERLFEGEVEG